MKRNFFLIVTCLSFALAMPDVLGQSLREQFNKQQEAKKEIAAGSGEVQAVVSDIANLRKKLIHPSRIYFIPRKLKTSTYKGRTERYWDEFSTRAIVLFVYDGYVFAEVRTSLDGLVWKGKSIRCLSGGNVLKVPVRLAKIDESGYASFSWYYRFRWDTPSYLGKPTDDFEVNTRTGQCFKKRIRRESSVGKCSLLPLREAERLYKGKKFWQDRYRNFIAPSNTDVQGCTAKFLNR